VGTLVGANRLFWGELHGRFFDIVISPRWDFDTFLATFLCGLTRAPITVGYEDGTSAEKRRWNSGFQRTWNVLLGAGPLQHEVERNLAVGRALGCDENGRPPELTVTPEEHGHAQEWMGDCAGALVVALGLPAGHRRKHWTAERYLSTLRLLGERCAIRPVLFADGATSDLARSIMDGFPQTRLAMELPLTQVAAIISECDVFIGSDSGLGHLAAAVGCPTVTLTPHARNGDPTDPLNPVRFRPYGPRSVVLQPKVARPGCKAGCRSNAPHCILDIDPQDATEAVLQSVGFCGRTLPGQDMRLQSR
jgi:heptosyltransferase-2